MDCYGGKRQNTRPFCSWIIQVCIKNKWFSVCESVSEVCSLALKSWDHSEWIALTGQAIRPLCPSHCLTHQYSWARLHCSSYIMMLLPKNTHTHTYTDTYTLSPTCVKNNKGTLWEKADTTLSLCWFHLLQRGDKGERKKANKSWLWN